MREDTITIEVLPDGKVKFTTPKISGANHQSADAFLKAATDLLGGTTTVTRRVGADLRSALDAHAADGHSHDIGHGHSH